MPVRTTFASIRSLRVTSRLDHARKHDLPRGPCFRPSSPTSTAAVIGIGDTVGGTILF